MALPPTAAPSAHAPFDVRLVRMRRVRAAQTRRQADFLAHRVAEDFAERLDSVNRSFARILVIGADDTFVGAVTQTLKRRNGDARIVVADWSGGDVQCDPERLPFGDGSFDLVLSSLALHWVNDLPGALIQIRRALEPDGLFIGALLGGRTLQELRTAILEAELELRGGAAARVSPFANLEDVAGLMQRAGFALPVADRDTLTVRYLDPLQVLRDLRSMGETACPATPAPPLTRAILARMLDLYPRSADGRTPTTFEILTATGWRPHPSQPKPLKPGSAKTRLADALGVAEHRFDALEDVRAQAARQSAPIPRDTDPDPVSG